MKIKQNLTFAALAMAGAITLSGCSSMSGVVKQDTSITEQTQELEQAGANYTGPAYTIGVISLQNKTPSRVLGIGASATDILRTSLKQAGLEPIMLTNDELSQQDRLVELQQSGVVKTGKKDAAAGMDSIDFRVSGAITSYSEVAEGSNLLVTSSKTQIARVGVDYALVDVASGRTLVAKSGQGEYRKTARKVLGLGDSTSSDTSLRDGALRDAMNKAVTSMIKELSERPFQSRVILVDGETVLFRGGTKSKLQSGTRLAVYRPGKDLIDPDTGRVLGKRETRVGEIVVSSHQNEAITLSQAVSGKARKGDIVKVIK